MCVHECRATAFDPQLLEVRDGGGGVGAILGVGGTLGGELETAFPPHYSQGACI